MNTQGEGSVVVRSPPSENRWPAVDGRALGRPRFAPAFGGWLRPGRPRWPACPVLGRASRPAPGLQRWGAWAAPLRGVRFRPPAPRAACGVGAWLGVRGSSVCPPPRATPARGVVRVAVPPSAPLAAACLGLALGGAPPGWGFASLARRGVPPLRRRLARLAPRRHTKRVALPLPWLRQGGIHATRAAGPLASPHAPHSLSASAYSIVTSGLSCCSAFCTFARS